jgi:anaerobic ribonucleoside-triphosphate reductase activating protein
VSSLLHEVAAVRAEIEGVTLLGGEPFDQADGLGSFARGVRDLGLSVVAFTGYTLDELRSRRDPATHDLLAAVDLLVDGRYDATRPEAERLWVGSRNQRFHYLTPRYTAAVERPGPEDPLRTVEVRVGADGRLSANGWPELSPSPPGPFRS